MNACPICGKIFYSSGTGSGTSTGCSSGEIRFFSSNSISTCIFCGSSFSENIDGASGKLSLDISSDNLHLQIKNDSATFDTLPPLRTPHYIENASTTILTKPNPRKLFCVNNVAIIVTGTNTSGNDTTNNAQAFQEKLNSIQFEKSDSCETVIEKVLSAFSNEESGTAIAFLYSKDSRVEFRLNIL